ncbi:MAG: ATP-binding protein [Actinomycetota bacterium]|nr:ATP-binding protein [Actinomycetota bacterium]
MQDLHQLDLPRGTRAPALARRAVATRLADTACPWAIRDTAMLLVSELVTNAVVHSSGDRVGVEVDAAPSCSRVSVVVHDPNPAPLPEPASVADDVEHGRGLLLLDMLASRWGWEPTASGKRVWFELC